MRIIVTGGAGFIGSHITDAYIKAGHRVVVIDDLSNGFRKNLNPKAKFYKADIRDARRIERIFKNERPHIVNHHAARAEVAASLRDPLPTLAVNALGTANLLDRFGKYGAGGNRKFIFASTGGAMYGDPRRIPAGDDAPEIPLSPYGLSKLLAEGSVRFYAEQHGFDYCIFRYANVYGPRQNAAGEAGVVAIFGNRMRAGKRPVIFGDGSKTRDYVYVDDIVRANLLALKRGKNTTMNLGLGKEVPDDAVFRAVAETLGFSEMPHYAPFREGELRRSALSARRARRILGWRPRVNFTEGVRRALAE